MAHDLLTLPPTTDIRGMIETLRAAHLDFGPAVSLSRTQQPALDCYVALEDAVQSLCALDLALQRHQRLQRQQKEEGHAYS